MFEFDPEHPFDMGDPDFRRVIGWGAAISAAFAIAIIGASLLA